MTRASLSAFVRANWLLVGVFLSAIVLALFLASRVLFDFVYFNDPANVDVDLKPWMTPRFVVVTYDLPRPLVFDILELDIEREGGMRLRQVAERQGITIEELTAKVRAAAAIYRENGE